MLRKLTGAVFCMVPPGDRCARVALAVAITKSKGRIHGAAGYCQGRTPKNELVAANTATNSGKLMMDQTATGCLHLRRRAKIKPKAPSPSNAIELGSGATVNARYKTSLP